MTKTLSTIATTFAVCSVLLAAASFDRGSLSAGPPAEERVDDAVAAIQKLGGLVRPISKDSKGWEVEFHLGGRDLTDAGLAHVAALGNVAALNLRDTKISDAGLVHLEGLSSLRWLHLERTSIGDEGVRHLAGLEKLEYLNLYSTKITDKSLQHLKGLKNLRRLFVWKTGVTDAGMRALEKELPKLEIIGGVDLGKLPPLPKEPEPPKPTVDLKWIAASEADDVPSRSVTGSNTQVYFENRTAKKVKLYWVSYDGPLRLYATIEPGKKHQQNTYAKNVWMIAGLDDKPLGYFIAGSKVARAIVPEPKNEKKASK